MTRNDVRVEAFHHRTELAMDEYDVYVEGNSSETLHITFEQQDNGITFVGMDQLFEDEKIGEWSEMETSLQPVLDAGFVRYLTSLVEPCKTWFDRTPSMERWVHKCIDVFFLYQKMVISQLEAKRRVEMYLKDAKKECRREIESNFVQSNF